MTGRKKTLFRGQSTRRQDDGSRIVTPNASQADLPSNKRFHTTVTERGSFRTCRRRWYYENIERLATKGSISWNLVFGDVVHSALAEYYLNDRRLEAMYAGFAKAWGEKYDWMAERYGPFFDMGIESEWVVYKDIGIEMLRNYDMFDRSTGYWKKSKIIAVNVEDRAFQEIVGLTGRRLPGHPLLSGRIDLVVERADGIWIWDHKTAAQSPGSRALDVDDQLTGYCYIYWRMFGEVPRGAIYNVLIKDPPKPPRVLADGSLSKDKSQRTSLELYLQTIHDFGHDPKDYEEFLQYLSDKGWGQFFIREGMERNFEEIKSFERRLYHEYKDMRLALKDEEWRYPNPSQFNCNGCPILALCQTHEEQGNLDYVKENMYEVQEPRHTIPEGV